MGFKSCITSFIIEPINNYKKNIKLNNRKIKLILVTLTQNRNHLHQIGYIESLLFYNI